MSISIYRSIFYEAWVTSRSYSIRLACISIHPLISIEIWLKQLNLGFHSHRSFRSLARSRVQEMLRRWAGPEGKEADADEGREGLGEPGGCSIKGGGRDGDSHFGMEKVKSREMSGVSPGHSNRDDTGLWGVRRQRRQDADYSHSHTHVPSLNYELENLIFARVPRSEYWKLWFVNKRCKRLVGSGEIYKIRGEIGCKEASVFMLASGERTWWAFDRDFKSRRQLPVIPTDFCFTAGDKESVCAGTHVLVSGREVEGLVIWRYELAVNRWFKGPSMTSPRCLFASATCGAHAFVAGGIGMDPTNNSMVVHDTAEKYNPDTKSWDPLPAMKQRRKLCSGCYMDDRFYVIGGRNDDGELTSGEFLAEGSREWVLIPDMLKDDPVRNCHSPPLVAVVSNELYALGASSNQLKVYVKNSNTWKQLGPVPVRADFNRGWGVAFKSLGNALLVIGASSVSCDANCVAIYTCCPHPDAQTLQWTPLDGGRNRLSHFILNCSVMFA